MDELHSTFDPTIPGPDGGIAANVESTIKNDSNMYNDGTKQMQTYHEELNTASNWHTIVEAFKEGRARDISDEPKAIKENGESMPCFIIGSGPSLDDAIEYLKDWKGGIICSTSHAVTLMHLGIEPTHIVALDPFSWWEEIKSIDWTKTKTKLVTHPGVMDTLVTNWPNELLMYIENNGHPDSFYATTQKRMYSHREGSLRFATFYYYIRTEVTLFASSPPLQLFIADILGYGTMFLSGVDFGFHTDKRRFTSWDKNEQGEWVEEKHPFTPSPTMVKCNNGLYSEPIHVYYKKNFLSAWVLSGKTIYTTDHGIITEIPYADVKAVVKRQGYGYPKQHPYFISDRAETYLAMVGAFVIETDRGKSFVECMNPLIDMPTFMKGISRRYICDVCQTKLMNSDDSIQEGVECPQCKKGKMTQEVHIDVDANMKRILKRLEDAERLKSKLGTV